MQRRWIAAALWAAASSVFAQVPLSPAETARVLSLGPWPPAITADPSNRVSGRAEAIALGRALFFDTRLSASNTVNCAHCHQPDRAWTDGRQRAHAIAPGFRNTQSLFNLRLQRWFGWGGSADSLWMASKRAIVDPREMGATATKVARELRRRPDLACGYRRAFGSAPPDDDERSLIDVAKALAAFQETLVSGRTAFDEFRDALARNDANEAARYPVEAQRGLKLFVGRANCVLCHSGPNFSNGEFHDTGVPFFIAPGVADAGRHEGIRSLLASRDNLLGTHNDDASRANAVATRHVELLHRNWGEFRTPSLRNVTLTAPYMHNGRLTTLREVLQHYSELDETRLHSDGEQLLRPLHLTESEIDDLLAFLATLTEPATRALPFSTDIDGCP